MVDPSPVHLKLIREKRQGVLYCVFVSGINSQEIDVVYWSKLLKSKLAVRGKGLGLGVG